MRPEVSAISSRRWWVPTPARCAAALAAAAVSLAATALFDPAKVFTAETPHPPEKVAEVVASPPPAPPAPPTRPPEPQPPPQAASPSLRFTPSAKYLSDGEGGGGFYRQRIHAELQLVTAGDTLYMLDGSGQPLWTKSFDGDELIAAPFVDSTGSVVVLTVATQDGLDAFTGEERWHSFLNGRGCHSDLIPYGPDRYFVVTDESGYREAGFGDSDVLALYEGPKWLWSAEIPAGASVRTDGERVSTVVEKHGREIVRGVPVPARFRPRQVQEHTEERF